jgi:hypothetical protein
VARLRIWSETLAPVEVVRHAPLLARYRLDVLLAVQPWQLAEVADASARLRDASVHVAAWPMLADDDGRWASVASMDRFVRFADDVVTRVAPAELAIDLEPPKSQLMKLLAGRPARTWRGGFTAARDHLRAAIARWRAAGVARVTTAVMPMLVAELAGDWLQRMLGTPTALPVDHHSVMAYTSLYEGWSRGVVDRRRAEQLLAATARLARVTFGAGVGLSLGTVGTGAFGDEPCYRDPGELARDVAIARRVGISDLSLFDLGGVVRRAPAEAWLEAFCSA